MSDSPNEFNCQPEVGYTARSVPFHQDVLALQVPVGDGRLALGAEDLCVQVAKAWHGGVSQPQHGLIVQSGGFEVVVQRAIFVAVSDQVELGPGAGSFNVSSYETCELEGQWSKDAAEIYCRWFWKEKKFYPPQFLTKTVDFSENRTFLFFLFLFFLSYT